MPEKNNPHFEDEFKPNPEEKSAIQDFLVESELQGGVRLTELPVNHSLEIQTKNTTYLLEKRQDGYYLSGSAQFCPTPTKFNVYGSGLGPLRSGFIGRGLKLEGLLEGDTHPLVTSIIREIREIPAEKKE